MSGRVELELGAAAFVVEPGGPPAIATLTLRNRGAVVDQFALTVEGLDAAWYRLSTRGVSLFPGDSAEVTLELQAPPGAPGGRHGFRVVAASRDDPAEQAAADAALDVGAAGALALELVPKLRRAWRGAVYELALRNAGNADRLVRLEATDPAEALALSLDGDEQMAPATTQITAHLSVRAPRWAWRGAPRDFPFVVRAVPAEDPLAPPLAETAGTLIQRPLLGMLPGGAPRRSSH